MEQNIKWKKVGKDPVTEVLAIGYQNEMLLGWIYRNEDDDGWYCENDSEFLTGVTHYIDLKDLRKLLTK